MNNKNVRIYEIDFFRGLAIILMIFYHFCYDLKEFFGFNIIYEKGIINLIGDLSALLFIIITGISCHLSKNNLKRGLKILMFAYIISIGTYIYDPKTYINFGILHLIGYSIILYYFLKNLVVYKKLILGTIIILLGLFFSKITVPYFFLFPLGLLTSNYASLDYYPLFPYFGVFLYGSSLGSILYPNKKSLIKKHPKNHLIPFMGKNSLLIYLIHQPLLLAFLFLLKTFDLI